MRSDSAFTGYKLFGTRVRIGLYGVFKDTQIPITCERVRQALYGVVDKKGLICNT